MLDKDYLVEILGRLQRYQSMAFGMLSFWIDTQEDENDIGAGITVTIWGKNQEQNNFHFYAFYPKEKNDEMMSKLVSVLKDYGVL